MLTTISNAKLCFCFTRKLSGLGDAKEGGATLFGIVSRDGKMNRGDKIDSAVFALHSNPLLCTAGWIGILLIYRFNVDMEPFPDYRNLEDFNERPLLRQVGYSNRHIPYNTQSVHHNKMYLAAGVSHEKKTHANRGLSQREMLDEGVAPDEIAFLAGYRHGSQHDNYYGSHKPLRTIANRAGAKDFCSPSALRSFNPARTRLIGFLSDDILKETCPSLFNVSAF
ncbi:MAG: hypothetical protein ACREOZ_03205, partial [Gloeomargaritales cyanobacterium]